VEPMVDQWQGRNCGISNVIATLHQDFRRTGVSRVDVIAIPPRREPSDPRKLGNGTEACRSFAKSTSKGQKPCVVIGSCWDTVRLGELGRLC
jgi:hypothetical protein